MFVLHCLRYNHLNHVSSSILTEDAVTLAMVWFQLQVTMKVEGSVLVNRNTTVGIQDSGHLRIHLCGLDLKEQLWSINMCANGCTKIQEVELRILMPCDKIKVGASSLLWSHPISRLLIRHSICFQEEKWSTCFRFPGRLALRKEVTDEICASKMTCHVHSK